MEMIIDIPRVHTAIAECTVCFLTALVSKRKISNRRFIVCHILMLFFQSIFLVLTTNVSQSLWLVCMLLAVLNMYFVMWLCIDADKRSLVYSCAEGFLMAEFTASFEWQIASFLYPEYNSLWFQFLLLLVIYGMIFSLLYVAERQMRASWNNFEVGMRELAVVLLVVILSFALSNLSFLIERGPFVAIVREDVFYVRTLVDFIGVVILYAYESRIIESNAKNELNLIRSALKAQYDQYRSYQTSLELLHIKYHDLKHQVAGLRTRMTEAERESWIQELEQELEELRPSFQTGSSVLDTILSGKLLAMRPHRIKFTCVADGRILEFIHVMDICTIFGNALDNAIESVSLIKEEEKRLVHLAVSSRNNFIYIQVSNYCDHELNLEHGYPKTTKQDSGNHGFGLKSIRHSVEKYNGNFSFAVKDHWFNLEILIPFQIE